MWLLGCELTKKQWETDENTTSLAEVEKIICASDSVIWNCSQKWMVSSPDQAASFHQVWGQKFFCNPCWQIDKLDSKDNLLGWSNNSISECRTEWTGNERMYVKVMSSPLMSNFKTSSLGLRVNGSSETGKGWANLNNELRGISLCPGLQLLTSLTFQLQYRPLTNISGLFFGPLGKRALAQSSWAKMWGWDSQIHEAVTL